MIKNPFQPAEKIAKKLKVLLYGASGSGKTLAALTFPRPAVIDTENGTDLYAGRAGVPAFSVLRAKTLGDVESAVAFIREDGGRSFDTLVIDAITVLYDVQKDAASKTSKDGEMNPRLWNRVNGRMVALYNMLTSLPVHVVVIARESEMYEGEGLNLKRTGVKPDGDKKMPYMFDFVVRMKMDHSGEIIKSRGVNISNAMPVVNWQAFEKAAGLFVDGAAAVALSDDAAADVDAKAYEDRPVLRSATPASPAKTPSPDAPTDWSTDSRLMKWAWDTFRIPDIGVPQALKPASKPLASLTKDEVKSLILASAGQYDATAIRALGEKHNLAEAIIDDATLISARPVSA